MTSSARPGSEVVQPAQRSQHVVEALVVGPRAAVDELHHEERVADGARVGLLPEDGRYGIALRPHDPHDRCLATALGAEHAVLLDPDHAAPPGPAHVEHQPAEPAGDDRRVLQPGAARRQPPGQPVHQVRVGRGRAALGVAVVTGEQLEQRGGRGDILIEPLQAQRLDLTGQRPGVAGHRGGEQAARGVQHLPVVVPGQAEQVTQGRGTLRVRVGAAGRAVRGHLLPAPQLGGTERELFRAPLRTGQDLVPDEHGHSRARALASAAKSYPAPQTGLDIASGASAKGEAQNHS